MLKKAVLFAWLLLISLIVVPTKTYAAFSLNGSDSLTGTANVAMPITDLQISGSGSEPIPVKLFVTSGTLSMSTTTGITFDGSSSGSTIYFSGSLTNVNNALASLTYTRASTGTDTLEVTLVPRGEVFFTGNNHLYKFISGNISANSAVTAAAAQTAYGATGYLATITSAEENAFVAARLQGDGWIGASDAQTEGTWKWITGPEAGTTFWQGAAGGSTVGGNYANWSSGEPNDYLNGSPGEDCAQFYITSSKWNDLPCSGSNLSGYVVEFGATGDMPTVIAKNISITTSSAPTVSALTPADNATGITLETNLTIVFSQTIQKGTGNILVKKTSDDSTIETIDVTSSQVTGAGTSTITINPNTTLAESTGYYVTIPGTAFKNNSNVSYAGISTSTTWNFTTGDFTNPNLSSITASSITNTAATITWVSNENASSKVTYGLTNSYGTSTSESDTSPRVTSHTVNVSSLIACTTYHYVVVSKDSSNNAMTSSDNQFTTTGCPVNATPTTTTTNTITASTGGTTTLTEDNRELRVETPSNFTDDASTVVIQIKSVPGEGILNSYGRPSNLPNEVGQVVFDVKAIINSTTVLDSFDAPVTINYQYTDEDVQGLDESTLWLYHYHNGEWRALDNCSRNTSLNTISCTTQSFSIFGLFGSASSNGSSNSPSASSSVCQPLDPQSSSDLFQIDTSNTQAILHFTPLIDNVNNYYVTYGYKEGEERFSTMTNQGSSNGILSYVINHLSPNTTYYFKIRPQNECSFGKWSNKLKITTRKNANGSTTYYKNFGSRVKALFPQTKTILGTNQNVLGATNQNINQNSCQHTVIQGDSLWTISRQYQGSGSKFNEIMQINNISSPALHLGQKLTVPCQ